MKKNIIKNNYFDINGKVVLITGASRGIGLQLSISLSELGAIVIGIGRSKKLKNNKHKFFYHSIDINNFHLTTKLINEIKKKYKKIDGLVNTAGITIDNTYNLKNFQKMLNTNLISTYKLTCSVANVMKNNKYGSIINFSSIGAFQGFSNNPGYIASKGALNALTKSLALDFGKFNIRVNNIVPGYIKTEMTKKSYNNKALSKLRISRNIINRWGLTKDLVGPVVFLISDSSSYITGSSLVVDGGFLAKGI